MPIEGNRAAGLREIDRFDGGGSVGETSVGGVGWIAHPDEYLQRASHAFVRDGDVWVVDPVDANGVDDLLASLGDVTGVVVLLGRHKRDAAAIATRHDVPVHVPARMTGVASTLDAPVERLRTDATVAGFEVRTLIDVPYWQEDVMYRPSDGTLYVPEALGTAGYFTGGVQPLGVHPLLRITPPTSLTDRRVERLCVGHGAGITTDADEAIASAVDDARRTAPRVWLAGLRDLASR